MPPSHPLCRLRRHLPRKGGEWSQAHPLSAARHLRYLPAMTQPPSSGPIFLGIDTGGTYTDAVLWTEQAGVIAKAKALTTRHDLSLGIAGAAGAVLAKARAADIKLVSMSTTLATNALVEGQGGRAALVMIGFAEADLHRDGLKAALGDDPVIFCPGGHDVHGNPRPLDLTALDAALQTWRGTVSGVAVCALFATRNPAHELEAMQKVAAAGLPVTGSHELTSKLGGPRRALTTLLNARLVPMIGRLIAATESWLAQSGIAAPLMVVRGDGALVSAAFARRRPIETILSGPAASLVGARVLTGLENAIVSDIGGTTTDIAVLDRGVPRLDPEGASVGGLRTMVEAVAMRTFGLGGDSEASLADGGLDMALKLGPRRLVPLSLLAMTHAGAVLPELERQLRAGRPGRHDGRFALSAGLPKALAAGLDPREAELFARLSTSPLPLDTLLTSAMELPVLNRLVARGLVQVAGFTPSDAAHALGLQANWHAGAAHLGAELFARRKNGRGQPLAPDGAALSRLVLAEITRRSAEVILETAFAEDGLDGPAAVAHALVQRAMQGEGGIARLSVALDRPVIGLGASAGLHYGGLAALLGRECVIPAHADVANAVGAVAGQVRVSTEVRVSQPVEGRFRLASSARIADFADEDSALAAAEAEASALALAAAKDAGAGEAEVHAERHVSAVSVEGQRAFIEAIVRATASGRPAISG